jgi:hypothetical protein
MANKLFNPPLSNEYPSGNNAENQVSITPSMSDSRNEARQRQLSNRSLIHDAFPSQGSEQPSHLGSQSTSPNKDEP